MNGIKMNSCRFYVNEDERVVICVIPNTSHMLTDFIRDHFRWSDFDFEFALGYNYEENALKMPHSFSGKAVCAEGDEWDVETGKLIAYSKAKNKCYRSFFRRANRFAQKIDMRLGDIITLFNEFGEKLNEKQSKLQEQINEKLGIETEEK